MAIDQKESEDTKGTGKKVSKLLLGIGGCIIIIFVCFLIFASLFGPVVGEVFSDITGSLPEMTPEVVHETMTEVAIVTLPEPTNTPDPTTEASYFEHDEESEIATVITNTRLGEVKLSYPLRVSPQSSNIVSLSIYRPARLASSNPADFLIVEIDEDAINSIPPIHGDLFSDKVTILVDERMKAELSAQAFEIDPQFPAIQSVDLESIGKATNWAWAIIAPVSEGVHVLNFRVFVDEESDTPSWFGAYQIEVLAPTPIPSDTPKPTLTNTPSPTLTTLRKVEENLINESTKLLLEFITLLGSISAGIFGIIRAHLKRQDEIAELEKKLGSASMEEKPALIDKIAKLESIKWWQFWK